jgi:hypothetical protein
MGDEEVISRVEYRGYLLIKRVYPGTVTARIRRPDGTWRYSQPTVVCDPWTGWVIARWSTSGTVEELATAVTYEAACQWVDRREVDVLQELASSGRYPVAPLARAVLDGAQDALGPLADAQDALGPLADALEETGDPQARQVRGWINT